jgi:hypothetical protein
LKNAKPKLHIMMMQMREESKAKIGVNVCAGKLTCSKGSCAQQQTAILKIAYVRKTRVE